MKGIADKTIAPDRCLLAVALPLTVDEFFNDLRDGTPKDYAKSRKRKLHFNDQALWEIDHLPIVNLIQAISAELKSYGLTVCPKFRLSDLSVATKYDVVTIVAHYRRSDKTVEFADGLFPVQDVVQHIPKDFAGLLDLTICDSVDLQDEIKWSGRKCIVIANVNPADLELRLILYRHLMKRLATSNKNYIDAYAEMRIALSHKSSRVQP